MLYSLVGTFVLLQFMLSYLYLFVFIEMAKVEFTITYLKETTMFNLIKSKLKLAVPIILTIIMALFLNGCASIKEQFANRSSTSTPAQPTQAVTPPKNIKPKPIAQTEIPAEKSGCGPKVSDMIYYIDINNQQKI
ncbi:hypothetical protein TI05_19090 [Achromatium sp. WMS3]|nr:hypothetical protein TI05_19090 [Achromatium sp. WMS3]